MTRICVVCEGQTEETFVRDVLAPSLWGCDLTLTPRMISTSPGHKGGGYGLDSGFPSFDLSLQRPGLSPRLDILKKALHADIIAAAGCRPERFIPYIQPYEFEALLFSDVSTLTLVESSWQKDEKASDNLLAVRAAAQSPEHINDRPETKPAAHLARELKNPSYHKRRHGPIIAQKIGLAKIESECAFFASWVAEMRGVSVFI